MIISHSRKFIFLKSRKTGGTSVEIALSKLCDRNDIITPITPRDELVRISFGKNCQNFSTNRSLEKKYVSDLKEQQSKITRIPRELIASQIYYNHMPLSELKQVSPHDLLDYTIISIERHPYEKAVSVANFHVRYSEYMVGGNLSASVAEIRTQFDELLSKGLLRHRLRNWDIYSFDGRPSVHYILEYSNLQSEFTRLYQNLGFKEESTLPITKVGIRDRNITEHEILTKEQKKAIREMCREEFEYFGYEP